MTRMPGDREVYVHLLPELAPPGRLAGGLAVAVAFAFAPFVLVLAVAALCWFAITSRLSILS